MTKLWYKSCGKEITSNAEWAKCRIIAEYEDKGTYVAEPKFDGIWCQMQTDDRGCVTLLSRRKDEKLIPVFQTIRLAPNSIFIGELGYGSQHMKKVFGGENVIVLFDIIKHQNEYFNSLPYLSRRGKLIQHLPNHPNINLVASYSQGFVNLYGEEHEGIILKRMDEDYTIGKQADWIKVKKVYSEDCRIIGVTISDAATIKGMASSITVDFRGVKVDVGNMTLAWRNKFAIDPSSYIGKIAEIQHWGKFDTGGLRHPSFLRIRDDK